MSVAANTTLVPLEEYLGKSYDPNCEYIDGALRPKPMPTFEHGETQKRVSFLIDALQLGFVATPEQTVRLRETKWLIPDVAVQRRSELQRPYPTKPIHLCVEILSPEDRFSEVIAKCEEYQAWGVKYCWIIDPEAQRAWEFEGGNRLHEIPAGGQITAGPIVLSLADLFAGF